LKEGKVTESREKQRREEKSDGAKKQKKIDAYDKQKRRGRGTDGKRGWKPGFSR
jgi:hypothetical protein